MMIRKKQQNFKGQIKLCAIFFRVNLQTNMRIAAQGTFKWHSEVPSSLVVQTRCLQWIKTWNCELAGRELVRWHVSTCLQSGTTATSCLNPPELRQSWTQQPRALRTFSRSPNQPSGSEACTSFKRFTRNQCNYLWQWWAVVKFICTDTWNGNSVAGL